MAATPLKVLIVDDDPEILRMASRFLGAKGMTVMTADSPFGVSKVVSREAPDVIVLDVMMPALDGEMLAGLLKDLPRTDPARILFYSALEETALRELVDRVEGTAYVVKTAGLQALYAAIMRASGAA